MALDIVWSPEALNNFHDVLAYLEENWHADVVKDFVSRTEEVIKIISKNPKIYRKISSRSDVREAIVTKHNLLLYRVHNNQVALLSVFDTRQHPKKKRRR